jgi:hypothetical protein
MCGDGLCGVSLQNTVIAWGKGEHRGDDTRAGNFRIMKGADDLVVVGGELLS